MSIAHKFNPATSKINVCWLRKQLVSYLGGVCIQTHHGSERAIADESSAMLDFSGAPCALELKAVSLRGALLI